MTDRQAIADIWNEIEQLEVPELRGVFADDPDRLGNMVLREAGIRFDFAKTHLTRTSLAAFLRLAEAVDFETRRAAMFAGEAINVTEGRAVEHTAERGEGKAQSVDAARASHARIALRSSLAVICRRPGARLMPSRPSSAAGISSASSGRGAIRAICMARV